jgi:hypothetical protein
MKQIRELENIKSVTRHLNPEPYLKWKSFWNGHDHHTDKRTYTRLSQRNLKVKETLLSRMKTLRQPNTSKDSINYILHKDPSLLDFTKKIDVTWLPWSYHMQSYQGIHIMHFNIR